MLNPKHMHNSARLGVASTSGTLDLEARPHEAMPASSEGASRNLQVAPGGLHPKSVQANRFRFPRDSLAD